MKTILKNIIVLFFALLIAVCTAVHSLAATQNGSITVVLEDKEKNYVNDIKVNVCQIAALNDTVFFLADAFENSGISLSGIINSPNEMAAKTVVDYIKNNNISTLSATSENGKATFTELALGIYVVYTEENGGFTFNPYIVFIPYESGGKLCYAVDSVPKLEDNTPDKISLYVIKKWQDENNASKKRPESVTIELLNGSATVDTVELNEKNGWAHTFRELAKNGDYSVREKAVPDYKADYSGDAENGFIVTNTYAGEKLPQTGQYWWPIILIAIAGACFVLLGVYEIGVKKNGKK